MKALFLRLAVAASCLAGVSWGQTASLPFLHPLFTDNMVLQRDKADPVWGWAPAGTNVTVTVYDQANAVLQTRTVTSASDGRWQTTIGPFSLVSGNAAYRFTVAEPNQTRTVSNVLIGDVWLCSGQSNMEYTLYGNYPEGSGGTRLANSTNEIAAAQAAASAAYIRQFKVSRSVASKPQSVFLGGVDGNGWTQATSNARAFTAVGYFLAKEIYRSQQVPVGLLNLTWGGTDILPWVAPDTLRTVADFTATVNSAAMNASPTNTTATAIYNSMVAPAAGFAIKGAIWLQGESSVNRTEQQYARLLAALRDGLRGKFGDPSLPFLVPQISTYGNAQTVPVEASNSSSYLHYPEIRNAQLTTALSDPNSRVIATVDTGYVPTASGSYAADIHPINKQTVGLRAGQAALNLAYGVTTPYLSPAFNHAVISGATIRCYFDNVGDGLMTGVLPGGLSQNAAPSPSPVSPAPGAAITGFAIAGADKVFFAATAALDPATNTVVLSSASVPSPLYVRYGWGSNPWNTATNASSLNLYRKVLDANSNVVDGVQVLPFRNDPVAQLVVTAGSGGGLFTPNAATPVTANAAPSGQAFAFWTGDTAQLANPASAGTTATLSIGYVSVRAVYRLNAAPAGLAGTAGNLSAALSWTALANASTYSVKRATASGGPYATLATGLVSPSYTDNTATSGTTWFYKVSATNEAGESPDSAAVSVTPLPPGAPVAVGTTGNTIAYLSWAAVPNVTGYEVRRSAVSGGPYTPVSSGAPGAFYVDTGLTNGTTYYYVVYALSGTGSGPASAEVAITPGSGTTPLSRVGSGGTATGTAAFTQAESAPSAFDGNTGTKWFGVVTAVSASTPAILQYQFAGGAAWRITQYQIATANDMQARDPRDWLFQGSNDGANWVTIDTRAAQNLGAARNTFTPAYTFANSTAYRSYRLVVTATFGAGNGCQLSELGLASAPTDAGDKTAPVLTLPANLVTPATSSSGAVVNFSVTAADAVSGILVPTVSPASGSLFPIGATTVACAAIDDAGNRATGSFTVTVTGAPPAPAGFSAVAGDGQVSLSWQASPGADSYTIQRKTGGGAYGVLASGITATASVDTSVINGQAYSYTVTAVNAAGAGPASAEASATPLGAAQKAPPSVVILPDGSAQVSVASSVSGRTYQLQRSLTLGASSWIDLGSPKAGGGALSFSDVPPAGEKKVFYRLLIGP